MSTHRHTTRIKKDFKFFLENPKYPDEKDIEQVCVTGSGQNVIFIRPIKLNNTVQPVQRVKVHPLFFKEIKEVGTVIFFENGISIRYHTAATTLPDLILGKYV
ncbi:MAG TPA: hypothetical protein VN843_07265 [Anaerolineales bacterium]|nr:hypothetical protein [Anaerolineales bacterium]